MAQLWMDRACQRGCRCRRRDCCSCGCVCFVLSHPLHISCKNENQQTDEERGIVRKIKDDSRIAGLLILLVLFIIAFLISCANKNFKSLREGDWQELVYEEEKMIVSDKLKKKVQEKLQIKLDSLIDHGEWEKCFTVGDEVIDDEVIGSDETPTGQTAPT
ncbi:hypothetical protein WMY93_022197 [Mugilogobius chulae]|uniref:Uncharacterized protein n=1 Tax=Mugilogobius chulae TaxID=88201 RepID=A0AAW0NCV9_9GOBI